jgi:hypothetical protein
MLELNEMIFLGACALLSNEFAPNRGVPVVNKAKPHSDTIRDAVEKSKQIWEVVLDEDRH